MSLFVIAIVLVSTFMHAGWNLLARYARSEGEFYKKMLIITLLVGFLPAVISELRTGSMTPLAWACVIGSGTSAAFYLFGLAKAFSTSDFTIVYTVARALPVIFIAIIDVTRGRYLTPAGWMSIILVVMGSALVPQRNFGDFQLRNYLNRASFWMVVAALGTVGYTFLDKIAQRWSNRVRIQQPAMDFFILRYLSLPICCSCARSISPQRIRDKQGGGCR